jgi:anti-sigma factor RsiW
MRCAEMRELLPAYVTDRDASLSTRRHLARCADCKAELKRYESMMHGLTALKAEVAEPEPGLVANLKSIPSERSRADLVRSHVVRNSRVYAGGVAVAAAAAGAALWRARRQRLAPV